MDEVRPWATIRIIAPVGANRSRVRMVAVTSAMWPIEE